MSVSLHTEYSQQRY